MKNKILVLLILSVSLTLNAQKKLQLEDCRQMALTHNKSLEIEQETVRAANQLKQAAFTQFLPNISAVGSYTWNEKSISLLSEDALLPVGTKMSDGSFGFTADQVSNQWTVVNESPVPLDANGAPFNPKTNPEKILWKNYALLPKEAMEFDIHNVFVGGINFVQPIFMGGKIAEMYKISKYNEQLAKAKMDDKTSEILVEVDEAYWRVVSLENKVALATQYRGLIQKLDSNMTAMVDEGVATKADALKIKVKLNEAETSLFKAENGLDLSRMALNQICGIPLDDRTELADQELNSEPEMTKLIPVEEALTLRPEIKELTQAENIAKSSEKITLSRFLPNIVLTGNYLVSNPNSYNGYENKFGGMFSFGVVAQVPITHFGERIHTLNAAKSAQKIANLKLEEAKEKMELQINQNTHRVAESYKKQISANRNIEQAEENMYYATEGFKSGVITSSDLLAAQTAWLSAKSEYIDATIDVKLCNLYLQKALGTLVEPANGH
ncbi:MAG: TolC family protein [Rikenellaceae bacterium]